MMEHFQQIDQDCAIAGQLTLELIQQLPQAGFKSVLNLRSPYEPGMVEDEQQQIEALGLIYSKVPVVVNRINAKLADEILATLQNLPKPILIYCASAHE
jgi:uncharacterized protein (TIGR01244 family)